VGNSIRDSNFFIKPSKNRAPSLNYSRHARFKWDIKLASLDPGVVGDCCGEIVRFFGVVTAYLQLTKRQLNWYRLHTIEEMQSEGSYKGRNGRDMESAVVSEDCSVLARGFNDNDVPLQLNAKVEKV
jgi:hypothetical protein